MATLTERFAALFAGLDRAYGVFVPDGKVSEKGKAGGRSWTKHEPLTLAQYEAHLEGEQGLGVVAIKADSTVSFAAIDIDDYSVNLNEIADRLKKHGIPGVGCRSKSGGVHAYFFFAPGTTADLARRRLIEWSALLGYDAAARPPRSEIFPKQFQLGDDSTGNWINLPYFAGDRSVGRFAVVDSRGLSVEEFVDYAESVRFGATELELWEPIEFVEDERFLQGPPCLQTLGATGFPDGSRNLGLFNVCIYLKKRFPDDWDERTRTYNDELMDPPLSPREVFTITSSVRKKDYAYKCNEQPICTVCNRAACLKREFGIGTDKKTRTTNPGVVIEKMVKLLTDPPTWYVMVNSKKVELATAELLDQHRFQLRVLEATNDLTTLIKPEAWREIVEGLLVEAEIVEVPDEATPGGALTSLIVDWASSSRLGAELDDVLASKPYVNGTGMLYFRPHDLSDWLMSKRFSIAQRKLYGELYQRGLDKFSGVLKGRMTNYWGYPLPERWRQTDEFTGPIIEHDTALFQ